jgi:peptidoglycan/LPS O-acetylase OafA/YrhL
VQYRAEIDGLRALAVLPVILFHAGFEWFSGGFVGVDVFFVISGYLITTIIISEMAEGRFSIINFYERRARRILPALFFVMLACLPFALLLLNPTDFESFGRSLIATATFSSNIFFWSESGYWHPAAELLPLLHTWSLAVEEQFYILFPIFLILFFKKGIKLVLLLLLILFTLSLGISHWGAFNKPSATFFLLPTRGWELLIGVFIAFYFHYFSFLRNHVFNQLLSCIGLIMIIFSVLFFDETTPFPSLYALIPTIGTGLIIFAATPNTFVNRLLSFSPFVGMGLISFSAYLWHQPLLAFARHNTMGEVSNIALFFLCFASIVLAYLSWQWVEKPFRDKKKTSQKLIFKFSFFSIIFFSLIGLSINFNFLQSPNTSENIKYTSFGNKLEEFGHVCDLKTKENENFKYCEFGSLDSKDSVILFGDSHSLSLSYALDTQFKNKNIKGILLNLWSRSTECMTTIYTVNRTNLDYLDCPDSFRDAVSYFDSSKAIIISNRWTMKFYPIPGLIDSPFYVNESLGCTEWEGEFIYSPIDENGIVENNLKNKQKSVKRFLELLPKDKLNILIYPIPETACDTYKIYFKYYVKDGIPIDELHFPAKDFDLRNKFIIEEFNKYISVESPEHIMPIKTREIFCEDLIAESCTIFYQGKPLYLDDDHLSDYGANFIVDKIISILDTL